MRGLTFHQEFAKDTILKTSEELLTDYRMKPLIKRVLHNAVNPAFFSDPCSGTRSNHPPENNGFGGIPVHTVKAMHVVNVLAEYFNADPAVRNCALTGMALHDIHKNGHPEWGESTDYSHPITASDALENLVQDFGLKKREQRMITESVKYHMQQWTPREHVEEALKPFTINPAQKGQKNHRFARFLVQIADYTSSRKWMSFHPQGRIEDWPRKNYDEMLPVIHQKIDDLVEDETINKETLQSIAFFHGATKNMYQLNSLEEFRQTVFGTQEVLPEIDADGGAARLAIKAGMLADDLARFFGYKTLHCPDTLEGIDSYKCPHCGGYAKEKTTPFCQEVIRESMEKAYSGAGEFNPATLTQSVNTPEFKSMRFKMGSTTQTMKYLTSQLALQISRRFSFYPESRVTGFPGEALQAIFAQTSKRA